MNLSGSAVKKIIQNFGKHDKEFIKKNVIIVLDNLDLPIGKAKVKMSGSSGGHNGTKGSKTNQILVL